MSAKAVVVFDNSGQPIREAEVLLSDAVLGLTNSDGYVLSPVPEFPGQTYVRVLATSYLPAVYAVSLDDQNQEIHLGGPNSGGNTIYLPALQKSFSKPSRDRIINVMANLCNLRDAQDVPIFEPFINQLILTNLSRADDWVARLKDAGSTHITTDLTGDYNENLGWISRYPIAGGDYTNNLDSFKRILDYLLNHNLVPIIKSGADGQGYDPIGMTYGWQWGMNNLPVIYNELSDYRNSCLWSTSYDGGFADWSPNQLLAFIKMMRQSLGQDACIDTEFSGSGTISYIHLGNGAADWTPDKLGDLDCFSLELQTYPENEEGLIQVYERLLNPSFDKYYRGQVTKKQNISMYETCAYWAIRKQLSPTDARMQASRIQKLGYTSFGNGVPF